MDVITNPCPKISYAMLVKGVPAAKMSTVNSLCIPTR